MPITAQQAADTIRTHFPQLTPPPAPNTSRQPVTFQTHTDWRGTTTLIVTIHDPAAGLLAPWAAFLGLTTSDIQIRHISDVSYQQRRLVYRDGDPVPDFEYVDGYLHCTSRTLTGQWAGLQVTVTEYANDFIAVGTPAIQPAA